MRFPLVFPGVVVMGLALSSCDVLSGVERRGQISDLPPPAEVVAMLRSIPGTGEVSSETEVVTGTAGPGKIARFDYGNGTVRSRLVLIKPSRSAAFSEYRNSHLLFGTGRLTHQECVESLPLMLTVEKRLEKRLEKKFGFDGLSRRAEETWYPTRR